MADCCEPGVVHVVARQSEKVTMLADLSRQANTLLDHAEDVAARLVEVICDLDWALRTEQEVANGFLAQRDAARAEVAAWERIWRLLGEPGVIGESKAEATWVAVRNLLDWIACGGPVEAKRAKREADRDRVEASND